MLSVTLNQSLAVLTHKTVDKFIVLFSFTQPPCPAGGCSPGLLGDGAGGVDMVCGSNCRQYTRSITASRVALSDGAGGVDMVCGSNCQQYTRSITVSRVALGDGAGGVDMVCGSNCRQYTRSITVSRVGLDDGAGGVDMVCGSKYHRVKSGFG